MLRTVFFATFILLCSVSGFSQKTQFSAEEKAIIQVIEDESKHFWARDIKSWKKCYVHEDYVTWAAATRDGVRQYSSWKAWYKEVKSLFEASPEPEPYDGLVKKYDYNFRIYGQGAWVSFKQEDNGTITNETRILEKVKGQWKIALVQLFFDTNESVGVVDP